MRHFCIGENGLQEDCAISELCSYLAQISPHREYSVEAFSLVNDVAGPCSAEQSSPCVLDLDVQPLIEQPLSKA